MNIVKPSCLCTLSTKSSIKDLLLLLSSLNYIKYNKTIYILCDSFTKNYINNITHEYNYKIKLYNELDKYDNINLGSQFVSEDENVKKKKWTEFMLEKTYIIDNALEEYSDVLFVDSDLMFINDLPDVYLDYEIGLCPHNILKSTEDKYGKYNGGSLWVNTKNFSKWWIENTWKDTTKYMEQQCLDDVSNNFKTFFFDDNYNFGWWRLQTNEPDEIKSRRRKFKFNGNTTYYNKKKLISVHTHFYDTSSRQVCLFNKFLKTYLNGEINNMIENVGNISIKTNDYDLI